MIGLGNSGYEQTFSYVQTGTVKIVPLGNHIYRISRV